MNRNNHDQTLSRTRQSLVLPEQSDQEESGLALPPDRGCVRRTSRSALECAEAVKCPQHARLRGTAAAGAPHTAAFHFPTSSVAVIRCARRNPCLVICATPR